MNFKYIVAILFIKTVCAIENNIRTPRSTLSARDKIARFNIFAGDFDEPNSPEDYFPDVEYPSDIIQCAKPYYFKANADAVLPSFPKDVKESFRSVAAGIESANEYPHKLIKEDNPILSGKNKKEVLNNLQKQSNDVVQKIIAYANKQNEDKLNETVDDKNEDDIIESDESTISIP